MLAFRTAKARTLWIWALILIACLSLHRAWDTSTSVTTYQAALAGEQAIAEGRRPSPVQQAGMEAATAARAANYPPSQAIAAEIATRTHLYSLFGWSTAGWSFRHLGIYSWIAVAECLAFMLVGMALYRSEILTGRASAPTYWWMFLVGALIGLGLRAVDLAWQARTGFELDVHRMNPLMSILRSGWYQPARLALTLAWVAGLVLLARGGLRFWRPPFLAMGRLALTVYTLQSLLTSLLFYAMGYVGAFGAASLMLVTLAICIITALFSMAWLKFSPTGPLERLLRAISYGSRRQKEASAASPPL